MGEGETWGRGVGMGVGVGEAWGRCVGEGFERVLKVLLAQLPLKQAAELAAEITGARGNEAYRRALQLKASFSSP